MSSTTDPNPTEERSTRSIWANAASRTGFKHTVEAHSAASATPDPANPDLANLAQSVFLSATSSKPFRAVPRMAEEAPQEKTPQRVEVQAAAAEAEAPSEAVPASSVARSYDAVKEARPMRRVAAVGGSTENAPAARSTSSGDFEVVLGKRQIASCLFAGIVLIAIFSTGSYFAGKMSAPSRAAASSTGGSVHAPAPVAAEPRAAQENAAPPETAAVTFVKQNGFPFIAKAPEANADTLQASANPDSVANPDEFSGRGKMPLFAVPQHGSLYLQMAALDRNMSAAVAGELRERGYNSFVAPGPSEKVYRVLVGPFATQEEYQRVKSETDAIDVNTLAHESLAKRSVARQ